MNIRARLAWLLSIACAIALLTGCQPQAEQVQSARAVIGNQPVVLLSARGCGYCKMLRADFKRWGVHYAEFDVNRDPAGRLAFRHLRGRGTPVTLVGMQRVDGYAPENIHQLITQAARSHPSIIASGD